MEWPGQTVLHAKLVACIGATRVHCQMRGWCCRASLILNEQVVKVLQAGGRWPPWFRELMSNPNIVRSFFKSNAGVEHRKVNGDVKKPALYTPDATFEEWVAPEIPTHVSALLDQDGCAPFELSSITCVCAWTCERECVGVVTSIGLKRPSLVRVHAARST